MSKHDYTAEYYGIPVVAAEQMSADMDAAASEFWKYPDEEWQLNFEEKWLEDHGFPVAAAMARWREGDDTDIEQEIKEGEADEIRCKALDPSAAWPFPDTAMVAAFNRLFKGE